jgi:hypothetical protein
VVGPLVIIALARGLHVILEWLLGAICALPPLIGRIQEDICRLPPAEPTWTYAVFLTPLIPLAALGALAIFWLRSRMAGSPAWRHRATSHRK